MIVFRKQERTSRPAEYFERILKLLLQINREPRHEWIVELLIEYGELESGIVDASCPVEDTDNDLLQEFRQTSLVAGHIFYLSWKGRREELGRWLDKMGVSIRYLAGRALPDRVVTRVPEGYAHYGLFPETYLEAAEQFYSEIRPDGVVCVGLRSIGASLSAIVSACLEELRCPVRTYTLRPRGEPFTRGVVLSSTLEQKLSMRGCAHYLIVDEGPGLSGSSLCGTAERISELGISDDRIVFFPSWEPEGAGFIAGSSRERWQRHRKFTASFEDTWLRSGRLIEVRSLSRMRDISAGTWRSLHFANAADYPAVHPGHEKRKFLCSNAASDTGTQGENRKLLKFAGFGQYGFAKRSRAKQLAIAGYSPPVAGLENGFLISEFVPGRPLSRADLSPDLMNAIADYLFFRYRMFPSEQDVTFDQLADMIRNNVARGLGKEWANRLCFLDQYRKNISEAQPVAIDGRMLPHEWLLTVRGYLKTDGIDHHADQFFPGCQDICWDLAGTIVEFGMDCRGEECFIERYESRAADKSIRIRLPFYKIAYLSFRLGFVTFACSQFGTEPDGIRFRALLGEYSDLLKKEITMHSEIQNRSVLLTV